MRIEPISEATERAALAYLSGRPYVNVFISYLTRCQAGPATRRRIVLALDEGAVRGVAYYGRQLTLACDPSAVGAFAEHAKRYRGERMIVGPRETVQAFWELVRGWHARPRIVRERQLVMVVDRPRLRPNECSVSVRRAHAGEWPAVAAASARTIEHELAYDPQAGASDFNANVRQMIGRELWWVGVAKERLCFFCSLGPWCEQTLQLQGVWTPPELRGRGLASASLAKICDRLLSESPTLSLYVNDFNEAAIALYRRVGFEHVADFQTILF